MRPLFESKSRWAGLVAALTVFIAVAPAQAQEKKKETAPSASQPGDVLLLPADGKAKPGSTLLDFITSAGSQGAEETLALAARDLLVLADRDPVNDLLGAKLTSLSEAQRAQLEVPAGQGVLVSSLQKDGPSALAGLKQYDILLQLGEHALAQPDDLTKHLKAAGERPVSLKLLRGGKHVLLKVRPIYRVTLGPIGEDKKEYYIGVSLGTIDEALRSQLNVPAGKGVIVNSLVDTSPAEAAGVRKHDIILEYGGKAIETPEMLSAEVQAGQDRPSSLLVLREGKPMKIAVTAAARNVQVGSATGAADKMLRLWSLQNTRPRLVEGWIAPRQEEAAARAAAELANAARDRKDWLDKEAKMAQQLDDLRYQVRALAEAIERLNAATKTKAPPQK